MSADGYAAPRGMPTVYIETTIPSFYFDTRTSELVRLWRRLTRQWWKVASSSGGLCTSEYTLAELLRAPGRKSQRALDLVAPLPAFPRSAEIDRIAREYIAQRSMPAEAEGDAYHLAAAALNRCDFLVTWNCRHLANANKTRHIEVISRRLGLVAPTICTPMNLLGASP